MPSKHRLTVNLSLEEFTELAGLSEASRLSRAWIVRQAVLEFLERHKTNGIQLPLGLLQQSSSGDRK